jgi:hypothetical protein
MTEKKRQIQNLGKMKQVHCEIVVIAKAKLELIYEYITEAHYIQFSDQKYEVGLNHCWI